MKRICGLLVLVLIIGLSANISALDWRSLPDSLTPKDVLISLNAGFGSANGGSLIVDYVFTKYGFALGAEVGFFWAGTVDPQNTGYYDMGFFSYSVPILARFVYHPDLGVSRLDAYGLLKLGFGIPGVIGFFIGDSTVDAAGGFVFNLSVGARYFLNQTFGLYTELGYEGFFLNYDVQYGPYSKKITASRGSFINLGLTFRIRGK